MTDKEKLIKIKSLADKMSDTAFNLTTDASLLKKAMDEYHQFIINEYHKEEQIIKELQEEPVSEDLEEEKTRLFGDCKVRKGAFELGAKWQKEQMIAKAIDAHCFGFQGAALFSFRLPASNYLVGSNVKVIVIKE